MSDNNESNSNKVKICPKCSAVNFADAEQCRICGEKLPTEAFEVTNSNVNNQQNQPPQSSFDRQIPFNASSPFSMPFAAGAVNHISKDTDLGGMSVHEAELFVGEKSAIYIPKFYKKAQGAKFGINWTVLLLGALFSPITQAFWFFHYKMNKIGAAVLALGVLLLAIALPLNVSAIKQQAPLEKSIVQMQQEGAKQYLLQNGGTEDNIQQSEIQSTINSGKYMNGLSAEQKAKLTALSAKLISLNYPIMLMNAVQFGCIFMVAAFADLWYYRFTKKKIGEVKANGEHTDDDIVFAGGVRDYVWALILIAFIILTFVGFLVYRAYL